MTEVPDYLLERSRARRAALGQAPEGGGPPAAAATPATPSSVPALAESVPAPAPSSGGGVATATAAGAALPATAPPANRDPRSGVPPWMMPVLLLLPLWGIMYMGAFGEREATGPLTQVQEGQIVYTQKGGCASCHGAGGGGGVGPKLSSGESELTFLTAEEQVEFVKAGSSPIKGQPYGNPARPGGQRIAKSGGMPTFGGQLTDEEIAAVVAYEREGL